MTRLEYNFRILILGVLVIVSCVALVFILLNIGVINLVIVSKFL